MEIAGVLSDCAVIFINPLARLFNKPSGSKAAVRAFHCSVGKAGTKAGFPVGLPRKRVIR